MKIEVHVPGHRETVDISLDDVAAEILLSLNDRRKRNEAKKGLISEFPGFLGMKRLISECHGLISKIPDEFISEILTDEERRIVSEALQVQADRFAVKQSEK